MAPIADNNANAPSEAPTIAATLTLGCSGHIEEEVVSLVTGVEQAGLTRDVHTLDDVQ